MTAVSSSNNFQPMWDSPSSGSHNTLRTVAFSVAEAALSSGPSSPSKVSTSMVDLMDAPALESHPDLWNASTIGTWPRHKPRRTGSFTGRPLWQLAEHAKERRELESSVTSIPDMSEYVFGQEVTLTTKSADPSPEAAFFSMEQLHRALPRLSGRDFAVEAEKHAATVVHARTQSDAIRAEQAAFVYQPNGRLPSLAQIQAKMNRMSTRRSDSIDSQDSEGPQTPTEEMTSFDFVAPRRPMTPDSPSSRLAPFLRERTNGRLARPRSMPPVYGYMGALDELPSLPSSRISRQSSLPPTPQSMQRTCRQASLPPTYGTPTRSPNRGSGVTLVVTPPSHSQLRYSPMSPTESVVSVASAASSVPSLPIITCTPAAEQDSDEESEADVIVFSGEPDSDDEEEDEEDRRMRELAGLEMRSRLLRRST
ncbi:uncharacterized protein CcaverHIS019_0604860 [Cutaneotrichosporon cavernicola]|uniref:Uncharacterized protein n=1 Tax=Cutaneotrichosporon cavernicola TaxID=279322 RepID=A0AA48L8T4_9TREE|nr:uncharacterized protein CcaverHIS019_0604860 [Cutaneotrichosporon cavernicola]BEI94027.1 hypothetical protein CcaverHIS019_0604860 [Cutaneotrichosporon cavernicola]BEJ01807.1 hypothetical protein CcaverHIS631_0604890 [Cutaneotrichosporon cavernicola]BEJ09572.1 hypothetical protein CcaverHIS641_0604870 [Cutaneotrichosporon cavernicola]